MVVDPINDLVNNNIRIIRLQFTNEGKSEIIDIINAHLKRV